MYALTKAEARTARRRRALKRRLRRAGVAVPREIAYDFSALLRLVLMTGA